PLTLVYGDEDGFNITLSYNGHPIKGNLVNVVLDSRRYGRIFDLNCTTDENGTIRILSGDLPAEEYFVTIIYDINENFTQTTRYKFFRVEKGISTLYADNLVTSYNSDDNLTVTLKDASGRPIVGRDVTVDLDGIKSYCTDENGQIHVPTNDVAAGSYAVNITFEEDWNYTKAAKLTVNVTVNKATPHIIIENDVVTTYGNESWINITFKDDHYIPIRGYNIISVEFDGSNKNYSAKDYITDENGTLRISTKDLAADYYWMTLTFNGNENFTEQTSYNIIRINKRTTKLSSDNLITSYNSGEKLLVNLTDGFGNPMGDVSLTVNFEFNYITDENGTIEVPTDGLDPGDYLTFISFDGNENYTQSNLLVLISIIKVNTTVDISGEIVDNDVNITVNVHPNATGLVKFEIKGPEQYIIYSDIVEGKAFSHHILTEGDYVVNATYMGDIHFNSNSTSQNFTVKGHIKKNTTIVSKVNVENYTVTITSTVDPDAGGFVTVGILGQTFIVPVSGGEAVFTYDFVPGTYVADVVYLGDDNFNNASTTVTFTVTEQVVELKNTTVLVDVVAVENDVTITASVDSLASGLVEFNIDGKAVYIVVNNGKAVYDTSLPAGDYIVVVTYIGDSRFNANRTSKEFTVTDHIKKNTTLISDVVIYEYRVSVSVDVDPAATGFVEFTLDGDSIFVKIADG
ncbi:MAG: Ig-like domain repeat protein, partial [Methanobrevibacter sp.]|nr:Ig-like domain repeat protein [Methanobrevibacter sp.]